MKQVQTDIDSSHHSGKSGDLSETYELVQQIKKEIDDQEEEKIMKNKWRSACLERKGLR